jgi:hypothetical protein
MKGIILKTVFTAVLVAFAACLYAGSDLLGGAFVDDGIAARPAGLGGAFTAIADDANASWWNPAGLGLLDRKKSLSLTYIPDVFQLDKGTDYNRMLASYAQGDTGGYGGIGGSISYLSLNMNPDFSGDTSYKWAEYIVALSWGMEVGQYFGLVKYKYPKVALGVNAKYYGTSTDLTLNGGEIQGSGFGADVGVIIAFKNNFNIGIMAKNLYSQISWKSAATERIPYSLNGGFFYGLTPDFLLSAEVKSTENDSGVPRVEAYCGGAEYTVRFPKNFSVQSAALRAGASVDPNDGSYSLAIGASGSLETFSVDFAYQFFMNSPLVAGMYRLGITAYF